MADDKPEVPEKTYFSGNKEQIDYLNKSHSVRKLNSDIEYILKSVADNRLKSCIDANKIILKDMIDSYEHKLQEATKCVAEVYEIINDCSGCTRKLREKMKGE